MGLYIYYTIVDAKGEESTVRFNITDMGAATLDDVPAMLSSFGLLIGALVDGGRAKMGFGFESEAVISWSPLPANDGADVQEKGFFGFRTADGGASHFTLPTIIESKFLTASKYLNLADSDVAALITAMEDGFTSGGELFRFGDTHDNNFTLLKVAREAWGKYRK